MCVNNSFLMNEFFSFFFFFISSLQCLRNILVYYIFCPYFFIVLNFFKLFSKSCWLFLFIKNKMDKMSSTSIFFNIFFTYFLSSHFVIF